VDGLKEALKQKGLTKDEISSLLNAWKSRVFEGLSAKDILKEYEVVAKDILYRIENLNA